MEGSRAYLGAASLERVGVRQSSHDALVRLSECLFRPDQIILSPVSVDLSRVVGSVEVEAGHHHPDVQLYPGRALSNDCDGGSVKDVVSRLAFRRVLL